jgi:hypothetical protein
MFPDSGLSGLPDLLYSTNDNIAATTPSIIVDIAKFIYDTVELLLTLMELLSTLRGHYCIVELLLSSCYQC